MVIGLLASAALGAPVLQLRAEPPTLVVGQSGQVDLMVVSNGRGDAQIQAFRPPPLTTARGLVAEYAGQQNNWQNVNGHITRIQQFEYRLTALEPGTWTVGPVDVKLDDGTVAHSEPVQVVVRARNKADDAVSSDEKFTVDVGFDHEQLWEGQLTVFHARFQSRVPGAHITWRHSDFDGLRAPQYGRPDESDYTVDDPAGTISVSDLRIPLVAIGTGKRDEGVFIGEVDVPIGTPDLFGLPNRRREQVVSQRLSVDVKALPPPPPDFSGLVGDFEVRSTLDAGKDGKVSVGESVPWTLLVSGSGSLEGYKLPPYEAPGASVYENDAQVTGRIDGDVYRGTAAFRRVVVPTEPGKLVLPETKLVTFSPTKGVYETKVIPMATLTVEAGSESAAAVEVYGGHTEASAESAPAVELRPPYGWGRAWAPSLAWVLPPMLGLAAAPGLLVLAGSGLSALVARQRARRAARVAPQTARAILARLPADPAERLVAFEIALRRIESRASKERVRELRLRAGRVRFGGGEPDPTLEADLRALVAEVEG